MSFNQHLKLACCTSLCAWLFTLPAAAEDAAASIDIKEQPLPVALQEFSEQTDLQLAYVATLANGKTSRGTQGKIKPSEALSDILEDTELEYQYVNDETVAIGARRTRAETGKKAQPAGGRLALEPILMAQNLTQQQADSDDEDSQADEALELDEVLELEAQTVTGSRLQSGIGASPVFVITRADIDARGLANIEDIVRYLPQNFSTITNGGRYDTLSPRFQLGSVTLNLRGLGEGSTLVLVNGRRIAASPAETGTFADVSTLPFSAIERVEVMTDGASAVYGSDAVGGVVNFIMKKNYRGSESSIRYENSSSGGHRKVVEQSLGFSWDTGNLTASVNWRDEDAVYAGDAGLDIDGDFREQGGRAWAPNYTQPGHLRSGGAGLPSNAPPNTRRGILPDGDGTNINPDDVIWVSNEEFVTQSGNFNLFPFTRNANSAGEAIPASEHLSAYLSLTQEFGESLTLSLSGSFARQDSYQSAVSSDIRTTVPASNYYNPFGKDVHVGYAFEREIADGKLVGFARTTDLERLNLSASLSWETPIEGWTATFSANHGTDKPYAGYPGSLSSRNPELVVALASSDPAEAINPFGDGTVQRATLQEFVTYETRGARDGSQDVVGLSLAGSLFNISGGPVELAVGTEARTDTLDFDSFLLNPFTFRVPDAPEIVPESENTAWFFELSAPLIGDSNSRPGIQKLNVYAAGRYDEYEIEGPFEGILQPASKRKYDDFVTKLGVVYYPVEALKLRATWGQAFLAATLPELFRPRITYTHLGYTDPLNPIENGGPYVRIFPTSVRGGSPDLLPQTSDTITLGFDYTPVDMPGLYLSASWSKTEYENLISSVYTSLGRSYVYALENWQQFPDQVRRDANGVLTYVADRQSFNLSGRTSEAVDFVVRYTFDTAMGEFAAGILGTRTLKLETAPLAGADPIAQEGTNQGPVKMKGSAYLDWSRGDWGANLTINHESSYENISAGARLTDVDGYTTVDLQGTYTLPESGWRITAGVQNILDADFPFFDGFNGVHSAHVDFRRRVAFVDIVKEFSW